MKRKFVFCWLLLASSMLSGFFSGCGGGGSDSSLLDELIRNRSLWQSQRLSSYSLEYTETCFCALSSQQVHVVVEDAVVVQAQINQNGTTVDVELSQVRSIDGLFDYIIQIEKLNPDFISIEYDPVYGYPRRFSADLSQTLVDDEVSWEVSLNVINNRSCGPVDCPAGLQCCNSSCGICTLPGGACIQIACL